MPLSSVLALVVSTALAVSALYSFTVEISTEYYALQVNSQV